MGKPLRSCYGYKRKKKRALKFLRSEYTSDIVSPDGKTREKKRDPVASNNCECLITTSLCSEEVLILYISQMSAIEHWCTQCAYELTAQSSAPCLYTHPRVQCTVLAPSISTPDTSSFTPPVPSSPHLLISSSPPSNSRPGGHL